MRAFSPYPSLARSGRYQSDVGAQRPQDAYQHRGGADPVDVVVAVHGDPRPGAHLGEDRRERLVDALKRGGRMLLIGRQERTRPLGVGQPAAHQHLRDRPTHPQLPFERLHLGLRARRDLEAAARHHPPPTLRVGLDGTTGLSGRGVVRDRRPQAFAADALE